jgi:hypothetical protein
MTGTHSRSVAILCGLLAALILPMPGRAETPVAETGVGLDEILLKNGSRILGSIVGLRDGEVRIDTDFAGTIVIAVDQIATVRTAEPAVLMLADDSVVESDSIRVEEERVVVTAGDTGAQVFAIDDLLVVNPEPWELGLGYKWTGSISFAWGMQRGNTDTDELDYRLESFWRGDDDRYTLKFSGENDETNGVKNADNWLLIGKYDHFISDLTYWGINVSAESDKFRDLDLRYLAGPYIGHDFFTDPLFTLEAELGVAYVNEDFIEAEDQDYPAATWNLRMTSDYLGGDSLLYFDQRGIWNLSHTSDAVIDTGLGLSFPLLWGLEAAAEILWEYDSGAVEDVDELDETYRLRIGYTW